MNGFVQLEKKSKKLCYQGDVENSAGIRLNKNFYTK